ncbi:MULTISPECIES: effector-associated constant component EACC1 [unclassified Streptomyces]|uniref:effector-associated constant component EACC1 n=1 Tax=unclassified Streptomyces TaxID=2593676 RepID=UPI0033303B0E
MEVNLTFGDGTSGAHEQSDEFAASVLSLYRWLVTEPELRGHARVSTGTRQAEQGRMGDGLDLVNVVLANSIALGGLVTAVAAWRGSRPRPPQVRLERDGVVIDLRDCSPETVEQVLRLWNQGPGASPPPQPAPAPAPADGDDE